MKLKLRNFILNNYRGKIPILVNDERVSEILFREIARKILIY
jgi:hypothetical protein